MLLMGDEVRRTQGGNNNAYCQDNETGWFDWSLLSRHASVHRFVKQLVAYRVRRDLAEGRLGMTLVELLRKQPVQWHGIHLNAPDWSSDSHTLAATLRLLGDRYAFHMMANAYWEELPFEIPPVFRTDALWMRWIDTSLDPPDDITEWEGATAVRASTYRVGPRSVVVLVAGTPPPAGTGASGSHGTGDGDLTAPRSR